MVPREVLQTKKGHKYIKLSLKDMIDKLNGCGICDSCAKQTQMKNGFLIPVLNSVYCNECFDEWSARAEYYAEDFEYENNKVAAFKAALK